jgi:predicted oxidoreductase
MLPTLDIGHDRRTVSKLALGLMGLAGTWNPAEVSTAHIDRAVKAFEAALAAGITVFDQADIYGNGACESVFKSCLSATKPDRETLYIATKCGIRFEDATGPYRYDLAENYIVQSLEKSLARMGLDYVDLYQVHRPDPLTHPAETARALNALAKRGLVRHVGVSNYSPSQTETLQTYLDVPLATTQPQFSLVHLEPMTDGTLDLCERKNICVMAYSPLGHGKLSRLEVSDWLRHEFQSLTVKYNATPVQLSLAWLMQHPAGVIPVFGSNSPDHIREAAHACTLTLSHGDWYRLWTAARGEKLP